jgi:short subunit dehydrogenase-like uncharacterized protein
MVKEANRQGIVPEEVSLSMLDCKGGVSGGTIASVMNMMETLSTSDLRSLSNPYYLTPVASYSAIPSEIVKSGSDKLFIGYDPHFKLWSAPYIMQGVDTRVVHRSNFLNDWGYGKELIYTERTLTKSFMSAAALTVATLLGFVMLAFSPTRYLLKFLLPKRGEGPSKHMQENGYFRFGGWVRGKDAKSGDMRMLYGYVNAPNGDPGYT